MAISKVIYKTSPQDTGTVWMDATPATAAASDITAPKTAMLADGVLTTGTGSGGGGGGLEYEEGTWTPVSDIADTSISFANPHSEPPVLVMLTDTDSESIGVDASNAVVVLSNMNEFLGHPVVNGSTSRYGMYSYIYTSGTSLTGSYSTMSAISSLNNFFTSTSFRAYTGSTSRYWRAGRTYKWIAVWKPTT